MMSVIKNLVQDIHNLGDKVLNKFLSMKKRKAQLTSINNWLRSVSGKIAPL